MTEWAQKLVFQKYTVEFCNMQATVYSLVPINVIDNFLYLTRFPPYKIITLHQKSMESDIFFFSFAPKKPRANNLVTQNSVWDFCTNFWPPLPFHNTLQNLLLHIVLWHFGESVEFIYLCLCNYLHLSLFFFAESTFALFVAI